MCAPTSMLLGALCVAQAGCAGVGVKEAQAAKPTEANDVTGRSSSAELAQALDRSCKQSDFAMVVSLVHPDERADMAATTLAASSMQCLMLSATAGALSGGPEQGLNVEGLSSLGPACEGMAQVAARYGSPFELWQSAVTAASEPEQAALWKKARASLDGVDVSALLRELQDIQTTANAKLQTDFPCFRHGVHSSALKVEGDTARVPVREATGYFAFVRLGERWFVSLEHSDPGETNEELAAHGREQAMEADQKALREAVHGTWAGPWGRVEFRPDGGATFETRSHCSSDPERPWQTQPGSCTPTRDEGKVELSPYEIGLANDRGTNIYGAYVDSAGRLHIVTSLLDVGKLDAQRNGQVKLSMFRTLHVQGESCRLEDSMENSNEAVGCAFVKEDGLDLLRIEVASDDGKNPVWLVYLPDQGLLVPPELYATAYERASN